MERKNEELNRRKDIFVKIAYELEEFDYVNIAFDNGS